MRHGASQFFDVLNLGVKDLLAKLKKALWITVVEVLNVLPASKHTSGNRSVNACYTGNYVALKLVSVWSPLREPATCANIAVKGCVKCWVSVGDKALQASDGVSEHNAISATLDADLVPEIVKTQNSGGNKPVTLLFIGCMGNVWIGETNVGDV